MKLGWHRIHAPNDVQKVKDFFINALKPYHAPGVLGTPQQPVNPSARDNLNADNILGLDLFYQPVVSRTIVAEVDAYLLDESPCSRLVNYWQINVNRFPTIYSSMDLLPFQASTVPCEDVFSDSKEDTSQPQDHGGFANA
ncbi:hypothetical protein K435DRAFT_877369 [Dendrothele bispora CBS 962.96]|uniref:HAT C-terminal dimerisation domain-containing protein n=1 Tax=Dendrothele bispora (strain CBS 962.96) TaxID=1314807 RepID=A0A4S8KQE9_DENBC|nr:hypothetical protein K435DRAFT_877369 [Dendrothele bispora CBS 962.96]